MRKRDRLRLFAATLLSSGVFAAAAPADPPALSPQSFFVGDQAKATATDSQEFSRIAAGGPGYLVVWEEHRAVISGVTATNSPLTGNQIDIYGARLDPSGNVIDSGPILISQEGRNQTKPQVAWNAAANAWLVVWTSERPDWYFFEDVVGVRVSASGQVLDAAPIPLRPESNTPSNDYAESPTVASDGTNWLVAWVDVTWSPAPARPRVSAKRVNASGVMLDPAPVILYQHPDTVFGPIVPHLAWAGDEYLLVWERAGFYDILGKRIGADLHAIDATPFMITTTGYGPRVATNGTDFLVVSRYFKAHRVTHAGVSLDPAGIDLTTPPGSDFRGPDVAWNGAHYVTVNSGSMAGHASIWMARISTAGTVLGTTEVHAAANSQYNAAVASNGGGTAQVVWAEIGATFQYLEDVRGTLVDAGGIGGAVVNVSAGLHRQTYLRIAENGAERLMVFLSEGGGVKRIVAQRVSATGDPIDAEPVELATIGDSYRFYPDVAWNGTYYLVTWAVNNSIYARRLNASGQPVDAAPVLILTDTASAPAAGTLAGNFYIAYVHTFSVDLNYLKGVRVDPITMTTIGSAVQIGPGYVVPWVQVREFGGRAFVVYEDQGNHDVVASTITALFVDPSGVPSPYFHIGTEFNEDQPAVAVAGDRALVTWSDRETYNPSALVGRIVNADGTFAGATFLVAEAPNEQMFSACAWDGTQFVAAWTDYRAVSVIEQLRGNIWAARIGPAGVVLDPGGFPVTDDALPEDLPKVTGGDGRAMIAYSRLSGPAGPEVQRIGFRMLGAGTAAVPAGSPGAGGGVWYAGPNPFRDRVEITYAADPRSPASNMLIEIFGVDGRRVAHGPMAGGSLRFTWNGRTESGASVPSGVYFIRASDASDGGRVVFNHRAIRIE